MANPQQNETFANMNNDTDPNARLNIYNNPGNVPAQPPIYMPVQPVPVAAGVGTPGAQPGQPVILPVQPIYIQAPPQQNNNPQVVVIRQEKPAFKSSGRACYCRGPRQSPCGCCDPNEEYCCIVIVFAYILMSLRYILTCLCILSLCRSLRHGCW